VNVKKQVAKELRRKKSLQDGMFIYGLFLNEGKN